MKNLLFIILAVLVSFSFSCSSGKKSSSNTNSNTNTNGTNKSEDEWTTLDYHYRTGSVAPEYYYHYRIIINKDKTGQFIFYPSYADTGFSQESFTITDSQLSLLDDAVKRSKVLDGNIPSLPDNEHPIGGHTEVLTVIIVNPDPDLDQMPKHINVPAFPEPKYKEGLEKLYSAINSVLPAGMLQDAIDKKEFMSK